MGLFGPSSGEKAEAARRAAEEEARKKELKVLQARVEQLEAENARLREELEGYRKEEEEVVKARTEVQTAAEEFREKKLRLFETFDVSDGERRKSVFELVKKRDTKVELFLKKVEELSTWERAMRDFFLRVCEYKKNHSKEFSDLAFNYPKYFAKLEEIEKEVAGALDAFEALLSLVRGEEVTQEQEGKAKSIFDNRRFAIGSRIMHGWHDSAIVLNDHVLNLLARRLIVLYQLFFEAMPIEIPGFREKFPNFETEKIPTSDLIAAMSESSSLSFYVAEDPWNNEPVKRPAGVGFQHAPLYGTHFSNLIDKYLTVCKNAKDLSELFLFDGMPFPAAATDGSVVRINVPVFAGDSERGQAFYFDSSKDN